MSTTQQSNGKLAGRYGTLAMGAVGGLLLGRFLPVLFANASGAARAAAGQDPFEGLIREHRQLLSLLTKMENTPRKNRLKRLALFFTFKRTIGKHAMAEEDIIYPLLRNDAARVAETEKLYREHARMKVLLFELDRSVNEDEAWSARVRDLRNEIEPHARQEEEVEFPHLRALIEKNGATRPSNEGLSNLDLSRKIRQEESLVV